MQMRKLAMEINVHNDDGTCMKMIMVINYSWMHAKNKPLIWTSLYCLKQARILRFGSHFWAGHGLLCMGCGSCPLNVPGPKDTGTKKCPGRT
ncbi:hypothetical protein HanIR_Chr09g0434201 [Helianthus annuus]|nr:hypothetical protein HanIR_Chr09g0434201 [Helianthus annuus]